VDETKLGGEFFFDLSIDFFPPSPNLKPLQPTSFSFFLYFCFVLWNKSRRRCWWCYPRKIMLSFFFSFFQVCETNIIFFKKNLWKFILFYCHFLDVKTRRKRRRRWWRKWNGRKKKQQLLSFQFLFFFHLFIFMNLFYSPLCRSGKES